VSAYDVVIVASMRSQHVRPLGIRGHPNVVGDEHRVQVNEVNALTSPTDKCPRRSRKPIDRAAGHTEAREVEHPDRADAPFRDRGVTGADVPNLRGDTVTVKVSDQSCDRSIDSRSALVLEPPNMGDTKGAVRRSFFNIRVAGFVHRSYATWLLPRRGSRAVATGGGDTLIQADDALC
jgi:hypothetical protein